MSRKVSQHLTYENSLLIQKVLYLEHQLQELNKTHSSKTNQHANTLIFLQHKNSELTKALLDKTKEVVVLQTKIHKNNQRFLYNNGDDLEDIESIDTDDYCDERALPPNKPTIYTPVQPITIIPQPIHPPKPKGWWGHHRPHPHPYHYHHGHLWHRDMSGNPYHHPPYPKPRNISEFDNPFIYGEYDERDIVLPMKKPTHFIPPARPHS